MNSRQNLKPTLLLAIIGGALLLALVVFLVLIFRSDDGTETAPENNDSAQQPADLPSTRLTVENLTSLEPGIQCTEIESDPPTVEETKVRFDALETSLQNEFTDTYGVGDEGFSDYVEAIQQVRNFGCGDVDGTRLFVSLSEQLEGADFHNMVDANYLLVNHPADSECAVGPYQDARFANAVIGYADLVQRSQAAGAREAHVALLTQIADTLGGELRDKCPAITEADAIKTAKQTDISLLRATLGTYAADNNGQLPDAAVDILGNLADYGMRYYNGGQALTDDDVTAVGTTPLTAQTSAQFLFGVYDQTALSGAGLPDADHFHLLFQASCNDVEEPEDYAAIGASSSRAYAIVYRWADEEQARCVDNS